MVAIVAVLAMIVVYISWRAGRLDRMHVRMETARASLDLALLRRSSVALELAHSGLLDPAASLVLADSAHAARSPDAGRELAESDLTRTLRALFGQPEFRASLAGREHGSELLAELEAAAQQVFLARKFYNSAVETTIAARRRALARVFRLAGSAPEPEFFEIEDTLTPPGLDEQGTDMPHLTG